MNYNYVFESANVASGHFGSKCAIFAKKAKIGEDYGLANLLALTLNSGINITPEDVYIVMVYYEDGCYRNLGLKARVDSDNRITLYGSHSICTFKRL